MSISSAKWISYDTTERLFDQITDITTIHSIKLRYSHTPYVPQWFERIAEVCGTAVCHSKNFQLEKKIGWPTDEWL